MGDKQKVDKGVALQAALRWSWSIPQQFHRLQDALKAALEAQGRSEAEGHYGAQHQRPFLDVQTETHMLLVAAHHLDTAVHLLGLASPSPNPRLAKLLRHIQEHWDDVTGPSLTRFSVDNPGGSPATVTWTADGGTVAIGGLGLNEVNEWAKGIYRRLSSTDPWPEMP